MHRCVIRGDGVIFESQCQAAKETGCDQSRISAACRGAQKTAGGYTWSFGDPAPRHIKPSKYCVWTLSDDESGVRFVGHGPTDDPLLAFKKVERAGLRCGLGDWIDNLDTPPKFAVALAGLSGEEAADASIKLIGQLPNLLNKSRKEDYRTGRPVILIFQNGRVKWFPTQTAACHYLGVKWNGIDLAGRVIRQRQRPGTAGREPRYRRAGSRGPLSQPALTACCQNTGDAACPGETSLAPTGRVELHAPTGRSLRPAAGEKRPGARRKRPAAHFMSVLCLQAEHLGGIYARDLADQPKDAASISSPERPNQPPIAGRTGRETVGDSPGKTSESQDID